MYASVSALPPADSLESMGSASAPTTEPGKRPWETSKTGYLNWAVGQLMERAKEKARGEKGGEGEGGGRRLGGEGGGHQAGRGGDAPAGQAVGQDPPRPGEPDADGADRPVQLLRGLRVVRSHRDHRERSVRMNG